MPTDIDKLRARQARVAARLSSAGRTVAATRDPGTIAYLTGVDVRGFAGRGAAAVIRAEDGLSILIVSEADRPLVEAAGAAGEVRYWALGREAAASRERELDAAVSGPFSAAADAEAQRLLDLAMRSKDDDEIARVRAAADLADIGYTAVVDRMTPDLRVLEIVRNVDRSLRAAGGGGWWSPLERPEGAGLLSHYPIESIVVLLGRGVETGVLDPAATLPFVLHPLSGGYAAAAGTTVVLSPPSAHVRSCAEALGAAVQAGVGALAPGASTAAVHAAFASALGDAVPLDELDPVIGYDLGTGMGGMLIDAAGRDVLEPGQVVTIRAAVPHLGGSGVAFQTTALVTEAGAEVLTQVVPMRLVELY